MIRVTGATGVVAFKCSVMTSLDGEAIEPPIEFVGQSS
jgi:hypothetical protein